MRCDIMFRIFGKWKVVMPSKPAPSEVMSLLQVDVTR